MPRWKIKPTCIEPCRSRSAGFTYKSNIVWHKIRKDGGSDGRGVGFYFRNVTELVLFGVKGKNARTLKPGRTQVNYLATRKREHSRKPDELYSIIEACSPGPFAELFGRGVREGWQTWGNQAAEGYEPTWKTYKNNSASERKKQLVLA
jgi:N6-adenosine-specific RNA methylase IME4